MYESLACSVDGAPDTASLPGPLNNNKNGIHINQCESNSIETRSSEDNKKASPL